MRQLASAAAAVVPGVPARTQAWFLLDVVLSLVMLSLTSAFLATLTIALH